MHTTDCDLINRSSVSSILEWALDAGKAAGIVTTTRITHATPAASYAHTAYRDWESSIPVLVTGASQCKDIARQLIENYPGNRLNVILGGGRREFMPKGELDPKGLLRHGRLITAEGYRKDGQNLIKQWLRDKEEYQKKVDPAAHYIYVNSTKGLRDVDYDKVRYLFGLFNHTNLEYEPLRDKGEQGEPSLTEMTEAAIKVSERNLII